LKKKKKKDLLLLFSFFLRFFDFPIPEENFKSAEERGTPDEASSSSVRLLSPPRPPSLVVSDTATARKVCCARGIIGRKRGEEDFEEKGIGR